MKSNLFTIIKKELARFFGDKRMVMAAVAPGVLLYIMYSFMGEGFANMHTTDEDYVYHINVVNMPESMQFMEEIENIDVVDVKTSDVDTIKNEIQEEYADLLVVFPENFDADMIGYDVQTATGAAPNIEIYYNSANNESSTAYDIVVTIFEQYEQAMANKFDVCQGDAEYDLATEEDITAMIISSVMPMLIMMMLFNGCLTMAAESIAGEKERGTMATLLVTPMKRSHLALGKMISLSMIGLISGLSSFTGIMLSLPKLMGGSGLDDMKLGYTAKDYILLLLVIIATTLLIVGAISIISALAKSVKEAGSMAAPLMLAVTLTGVTNMMSNGMPEEWFWYLIPVYNTVQCMNGVFSMDYEVIPFVVTVVANVFYSGILVVVLTKMFGSEKIMYT